MDSFMLDMMQMFGEPKQNKQPQQKQQQWTKPIQT